MEVQVGALVERATHGIAPTEQFHLYTRLVVLEGVIQKRELSAAARGKYRRPNPVRTVRSI